MSEYIIKVNENDERWHYVEQQYTHFFGYPITDEIVRCMDCINLEHWKFRDESERLVCCMVDVFDVFEDGFCAWGERKDEDGR